MIKKLKKLATFLSWLNIYWLSRLVPKSNKIWVFGAWHGNKYSDNSRKLFEYVAKNHESIRCIWITRNKSVYSYVKSLGYEVYLTNSIKGAFYICRSNVNIFNVSFNDISTYFPAKYLINLWHGTPIKKIGYDNKVSSVLNKKRIRRLRSIFPFVRGEEFVSLCTAGSKVEKEILISAFDLDAKKVKVTGLPRNDFASGFEQSRKIKKIIYMPTWREAGSQSIFSMLNDDSGAINDFLVRNEIELYVKPHPNNEKDIKVSELSNFHKIDDTLINYDIYSVLSDYDLLITDYSSIYFDYLLLNRPVIFFTPDHESYLSKDRELYFDYSDITPGPRCSSWTMVLSEIKKYSCDSRYFSVERAEIKSKFHKYDDGRNCQRAYEAVLETIGLRQGM